MKKGRIASRRVLGQLRLRPGSLGHSGACQPQSQRVQRPAATFEFAVYYGPGCVPWTLTFAARAAKVTGLLMLWRNDTGQRPG